jgi:putative phosphoesterase
MTRIGILSDTHLGSPTPWFTNQAQQAFKNCSVILHAGDLTDVSILKVFKGKKIHAVHGNMCDASSYHSLPTDKMISIDGYSIGLCHGAGNRHNIEERMWNLFPTADCIVYGHTHIAVNHVLAKTLFINPGSFASTGRYGAQGSYAILTTNPDGLKASIHTITETGT